MPDMGVPTTARQQAYQDVSIGPRQSNTKPGEAIAADKKEKLLNKLTNYKPKTVFDKEDKTKMDKDGFLRLLMNQLQNQDPMNPMEQDKISGDLAAYSQLEQLNNLNQKFDKFGKNAHTEDQFYGASFLGKEVVTSGNTMKVANNGDSGEILFKLDQPAPKVLFRIYDQKNNMVGEFWRENMGSGNHTIEWDGTQLDGSPSIKGDYRVAVKAWDGIDNPIPVDTKVTGQVDSVFFENGETILMVQGKKVYLRDVDSFHMPGKNSPGEATTEASQAKTTAEKLPIAANSPTELNLKKTPDMRSSLKAYKDNQVTTGLTDVYDIE